jgi:hypothetical protein
MPSGYVLSSVSAFSSELSSSRRTWAPDDIAFLAILAVHAGGRFLDRGHILLRDASPEMPKVREARTSVRIVMFRP